MDYSLIEAVSIDEHFTILFPKPLFIFYVTCQKLNSGQYVWGSHEKRYDCDGFFNDLNLVFSNAIAYNELPGGDEVILEAGECTKKAIPLKY